MEDTTQSSLDVPNTSTSIESFIKFIEETEAKSSSDVPNTSISIESVIKFIEETGAKSIDPADVFACLCKMIVTAQSNQ